MNHQQIEKSITSLKRNRDLDGLESLCQNLSDHPDSYIDYYIHGHTFLHSLCESFPYLSRNGGKQYMDQMLKIIKILLDKGADPFCPGKYRVKGPPYYIGDAPLYRVIVPSSSYPNDQLLQLFLDHGMAPYYKIEEKNWMLFEKILHPNYKIFKMLVDYGADINIPVNYNKKGLKNLKEIFTILWGPQTTRNHADFVPDVFKIKKLLGFGLDQYEQLSIDRNIPLWRAKQDWDKIQVEKRHLEEVERKKKEAAEREHQRLQEIERKKREAAEKERLRLEELERQRKEAEEKERLRLEELERQRKEAEAVALALQIKLQADPDYLKKIEEARRKQEEETRRLNEETRKQETEKKRLEDDERIQSLKAEGGIDLTMALNLIEMVTQQSESLSEEYQNQKYQEIGYLLKQASKKIPADILEKIKVTLPEFVQEYLNES